MVALEEKNAHFVLNVKARANSLVTILSATGKIRGNV